MVDGFSKFRNISQVDGTIVARSFSVWVIACLNLSQFLTLLCMWGSDWLDAGLQEVGGCSTRGGFKLVWITFASAKCE